MEEHYKKDAKLDDRLKNVYINSADIPVRQNYQIPQAQNLYSICNKK